MRRGFWAMCIVCSVLFLWHLWFWLFSEGMWSSCDGSATAVVTSVDSRRVFSGRRSSRGMEYRIGYSFEAGGRPYEGVSGFSDRPFGKGDPVEVRYDTDDPKRSMLLLDLRGARLDALTYFVVCGALAVAGIIGFSGRSRRKDGEA